MLGLNSGKRGQYFFAAQYRMGARRFLMIIGRTGVSPLAEGPLRIPSLPDRLSSFS